MLHSIYRVHRNRIPITQKSHIDIAVSSTRLSGFCTRGCCNPNFVKHAQLFKNTEVIKQILPILGLTGLLLIFSCDNERTGDSIQTIAQPQSNAIEETKTTVIGTYQGTSPGANSAMKQTLTLNRDSTYVLKTVYIDKSDKLFIARGNFKVENGNVVLDRKEGPWMYRIGDKFILQLDMEGKETTGDHAAMYKLMKQ
jgi:NlpE N-terminal domain